jgi:hypothetical protein
MKFVHSLKRISSYFTELDIIFHHINSEIDFFQQFIDIFWTSTWWINLIIAKSYLYVEWYSLSQVCIPVSQNPEVFHRFEIWANSFVEKWGSDFIGEKIILFEHFLRARNHFSTVYNLLSIISLSDFYLEFYVFT